MGKRGPKRTPLETRAKRGTLRSDRMPDEAAVVTYETGPPEPPVKLNKAARFYWDYVTSHIFDMGFLTSTDYLILVRYARESVLYHRAMNNVMSKGMTLQGLKGPVKNPNYAAAKDLSASLRAIEREFGLTASARATLDISKIKNTETPPKVEAKNKHKLFEL